MSQVPEIKSWYLNNFDEFENGLNGGASKPIHTIRKEALENFSRLNFPTTHEEEWRFTNITPLLKHNFKPVTEKKKVEKKEIDKFLFNQMKGYRLVFVDGIFDEELSDLKSLPKGVTACSMAKAIEDDLPQLKEHFGKYADYKSHIFTALSTAYTKDGAFIHIPDGKIIEDPFHVLFLATPGKDKKLIQPRNLFVVGKNAQVRILEHYGALDENIYFTNAVTEIAAMENAIVDHVKLQEESKKAFHIARMDIDQEKNSNFVSHSVSFGGDIARNDFNSRFNNSGGECALNGLYMTSGTQLFDVHTMIDHAKPYCNSHEHFKGILDDKSRAVFNGKVMVRQDAQKTNAFQENNNIILSNDALVNTKPQLEIFADDVKCSHGATVGQLDTDSMFYLKSRGIGEDKARIILLHAFASDVIKEIKISAVHDYIEDILENRFGNN